MSQEKLEAILREGIEGVNSKDVVAIQAATDPEAELTSRFAAIDGKIYRGHAGISDYLADMEAVWEDFRLEIEEFIPAGEEKLVVVARMKGTARGSGVPIDQGTFGAYEFRNGKALRVEWFANRGEALEAVGLAE
jgi:ketosteroid isomerase-like protein